MVQHRHTNANTTYTQLNVCNPERSFSPSSVYLRVRVRVCFVLLLYIEQPENERGSRARCVSTIYIIMLATRGARCVHDVVALMWRLAMLWRRWYCLLPQRVSYYLSVCLSSNDDNDDDDDDNVVVGDTIVVNFIRSGLARASSRVVSFERFNGVNNCHLN